MSLTSLIMHPFDGLCKSCVELYGHEGYICVVIRYEVEDMLQVLEMEVTVVG